jgi:CRP/FNR family cyclic AMP-dependent transcriptional regulator
MPSPPLLDRIPLLQALPPADRARVAERLEPLRVPAGAMLFTRGDPGDRLFVLEEGTVEAYLPAEHGAPRVVLRRLGPGGHFGELAVVDGGRRTASVVAVTEARLFTLARKDFLDAVLASPQGSRALVEALALQLRLSADLLTDRASRNVLQELDAAKSLSDRVAERVARWNGSWAFVAFLVLVTAAWSAFNALTDRAFDPYPFVFFNLVLAVLVALQGPLLMMAQNREVAADRAAAEADYRVNLKNEVTLERLVREVEGLQAELGRIRGPPGAGGPA